VASTNGFAPLYAFKSHGNLTTLLTRRGKHGNGILMRSTTYVWATHLKKEKTMVASWKHSTIFTKQISPNFHMDRMTGYPKIIHVSYGSTDELRDEEDKFIEWLYWLARKGTDKTWAHISLD
jgi:hypothetical protein